MLAEYFQAFPSPRSISSLSEDPSLLGTDDDLFHLDVDHVISDDDVTLDGLHHATNLNLLLQEDSEDLPLRMTEDCYSLQDIAKWKVEGVFGTSPGSDYLTGAYLTALGEGDDIAVEGDTQVLQCDLGLAYVVELSDSDDSLAYSTLSEVTSSCPGSPTAKRIKLNDLQWSEMDGEEKVRALDLITNAITDCTSIREQLELLRIVGQDMTVLPSDSRFQIDAANIDDIKLKSIRAYLTQMALHTPEANAESFKDHHHSESVPRHKKTMERRAQHKAHRKRRNIERKQVQKETRSGLFDQEVVLSLQLEDDDDGEINILD